MRSDSNVAVSPSPASASIQNLSSNLALQQFSNLSSPSQSISFSYWLSTVLNLAGVALMGLMTFNMLKGGSPQSSSGGRSNTVDHTITLKAEPIEVRAKGSSSEQLPANIGNSINGKHRGISQPTFSLFDMRPLEKPFQESVDKTIATIFVYSTENEKNNILERLRYIAANPHKEDSLYAKQELMVSSDFRPLHEMNEFVNITHEDESISIYALHAQTLLLETLLGSIDKNYAIANPESLQMRSFMFNKVLPELERLVRNIPVSASTSFRGVFDPFVRPSSVDKQLNERQTLIQELEFVREKAQQLINEVDSNPSLNQNWYVRDSSSNTGFWGTELVSQLRGCLSFYDETDFQLMTKVDIQLRKDTIDSLYSKLFNAVQTKKATV